MNRSLSDLGGGGGGAWRGSSPPPPDETLPVTSFTPCTVQFHRRVQRSHRPMPTLTTLFPRGRWTRSLRVGRERRRWTGKQRRIGMSVCHSTKGPSTESIYLGALTSLIHIRTGCFGQVPLPYKDWVFWASTFTI